MKIIITIFSLLLIISCSKETIKTSPKKGVLPTVKTLDATDIFSGQASAGGVIISEGSSTIVEKGICWSTSSAPTISSNKTNNGPGASSFTSILNGLNPYTRYYFRAYATNSTGTSYGSTLTFSTLVGFFSNGKGITDIDGNSYRTLLFGSDLNGYVEWMAEDLKTSKYNDGTIIKNELDDIAWQSNQTPAYRNYNNNKDNETKLYNFYTIQNDNVCPTGWHVPSASEWGIMLSKISNGPLTTTGKIMKVPGNTFWEINSGSNSSGFGAKGVGIVNHNGGFEKIKEEGDWWTSDEANKIQAYTFNLYSSSDEVKSATTYKEQGAAIRCVKN